MVTIDLPSSSFEFFDDATNTVRTVSGEYDILYGSSSADKDLQQLRVKL